jgi:hypothetical protein
MKARKQSRCRQTDEFGFRVAVAMADLKSSHVYFVLQKAFGEALDWSDAEKKLQAVIEKCYCHKCKKIKREVVRNLKS